MTSSLPRLIGLHSPIPGAGKSNVVARHLVEEHNYYVFPFADPIRMMIYSLLQSLGYSLEEAKTLCTDPVLKEQPIPELGVSPRRLMQTLGTEWGRKVIDNEIWLKVWKASLTKLSPYACVVVDDVRFENEVKLIQSIPGSELWWIERPGLKSSDAVMSHASQQPLHRYEFNHELINDGTIKELQVKINIILSRIPVCPR